MTGKARQKAAGVRYDEAEILDRIERLRRERGVTNEQIYTALGVNKGTWSRKQRGQVALSLLEFSQLAELLNAPMGWPFLPDP